MPASVSLSDTIYALATAPGRAGVAVLRISGPGAGAVLSAVMSGRELPPPRRAYLTPLVDPVGCETLDRGLVLWFPGPNSFTGEDVAELHVHGSPAVIT
ncbi:MAG: tRNA uridine-5-carboxymethylaminomethyl(34) synthesis GTPase MnmE, partial [Rhodospirillaceae bacterium]|nr:tRNA uridine-5-carboxymethylaminomethyl(34) synthesis GTPase MnmE [Rhodospirillaceae bacterium]